MSAADRFDHGGPDETRFTLFLNVEQIRVLENALILYQLNLSRPPTRTGKEASQTAQDILRAIHVALSKG